MSHWNLQLKVWNAYLKCILNGFFNPYIFTIFKTVAILDYRYLYNMKFQ